MYILFCNILKIFHICNYRSLCNIGILADSCFYFRCANSFKYYNNKYYALLIINDFLLHFFYFSHSLIISLSHSLILLFSYSLILSSHKNKILLTIYEIFYIFKITSWNSRYDLFNKLKSNLFMF